MDVFSHAIAGFTVGLAYGNPLLGAVVAVLPDLPLIGPRRSKPTILYDLTHTLAFLALVGGAAWVATGSPLVFLALASHLILDVPTHGKTWGPMLLYPLTRHRFAPDGPDWEWFSQRWLFGLAITFVWIYGWIMSIVLP
jgi:membrane-bound metal-dependent hydrolase YbcI (DUF457 family)